MAKLALLGGDHVIDDAAHTMWPKIGDEERAAVMRVLDRGILSGGAAPEARALEEEFAAYAGTRYALLTHSGTSALQVAVSALGIQAGDEVIVPAYSFIATAICVLQEGGIPRFVDVRPDTGNMDPALVEAAINARTKAIMPVHVHGCMADMNPIMAIAEKHGLQVIEDAAQAHGARYHGRGAGTIGAAAGFSLQSSKNFSAGEGGMFVTNDENLLELANRSRNFGLNIQLATRKHYDIERPLDGSPIVSHGMGHMFRGNEMMAAFARVQLAKLPGATAAAQENAKRLSEVLNGLEGITAPQIPDGCESVFHKFRVGFDVAAVDAALQPRSVRNAFQRALQAEGANTVLWQDSSLPEHPIFTRFEGYGNGWPFTLADDPEALRKNYDGARYPVTRHLLDSSIVLFSQSRPLIAQEASVVDAYANAFVKVWSERDALRQLAREIEEEAG